jgi:predicted permease
VNIWLSEIWQAWRASLRRPAFLLLASGVLALGVGASVAVFVLIQQTLLKPLPVLQPAQLVAMGVSWNGYVSGVSPRQYQHLAGMDGVMSLGVIRTDASPANISGEGGARLVPTLRVDHGLFPTMGVRMALGRNFTSQEDALHGPPAVILGWGFWQHRRGGRNDIIGRSLRVEGVAYTIVGVLPASFALPGLAGDIVLPTTFPASSTDDGANYLAVARLANGTAPAAVAAQVDARLRALAIATGFGDRVGKVRFGTAQLSKELHGEARSVLLLFLGSALLLLLIALVNLANLMLMRMLSRQHELAVRCALGAPLLRSWLPAMAEGVLVGVLGALAGVALAALGLAALQGFVPADWLAGGSLRLDAAVWGVALLLGVSGVLLTTVLGLWRARAFSAAAELREGSRSSLNRRSSRLGRVLVVAQVALATLLLGAAGVFLHTLYDAARVPLGFESRGILTFELAPVQADYPDAEAVHDLSQRLLERLRMVPGVTQVVATTNLPAGDNSDQFNMPVHLPGGEDFSAQYRGVSAEYFELFHIDLREGRGFVAGDVHGGEPVAIVNRALAEHEYGGHALGKLIQQGSGANVWSARIVGVVADTSQYGPLGPQPPVVYLPLAQMPDRALQVFRSFEPMRFALKVHGSMATYHDDVRQAVAEVAPDQAVASLRGMQRIVHDMTAGTRLDLLFIGLFAALALLLAMAGLYAVMAMAVAAREHEFGVRMALGAKPVHLLRRVLLAGLAQIGLGLLLGVGLAVASSRLLRTVLQQVDRHALDPLALLGVCVVLVIAGLAACLLPALRATRVAPVRALRGE